MSKTMSWFLLCFVAPFLVAASALYFDWFNQQGVSYGQFMPSELSIKQWQLDANTKWTLAMVQQGDCERLCQQRAETIANIYDVLGKHNLRVAKVNLFSKHNGTDSLKGLQIESEALEQRFLYLVDHRGLVVLRYRVHYQGAAHRQMKQGIIKDLKKLLQFSRSRA